MLLDRELWDNLTKWEKTFREPRALSWQPGLLANDYCRDCLLCCGPQGECEPFPMPLLPSQMRPGLENDFYLLDPLTPYIGAPGCKSETATGCRLPLAERPIACGLFPIVLANGGLYLYKMCPAVIFTPLSDLLQLASAAGQWLSQFDRQDRDRLSQKISPAILSEKYIDLGIKL